jgi:hypothetical protein
LGAYFSFKISGKFANAGVGEDYEMAPYAYYSKVLVLILIAVFGSSPPKVCIISLIRFDDYLDITTFL